VYKDNDILEIKTDLDGLILNVVHVKVFSFLPSKCDWNVCHFFS